MGHKDCADSQFLAIKSQWHRDSVPLKKTCSPSALKNFVPLIERGEIAPTIETQAKRRAKIDASKRMRTWKRKYRKETSDKNSWTNEEALDQERPYSVTREKVEPKGLCGKARKRGVGVIANQVTRRQWTFVMFNYRSPWSPLCFPGKWAQKLRHFNFCWICSDLFLLNYIKPMESHEWQSPERCDLLNTYDYSAAPKISKLWDYI